VFSNRQNGILKNLIPQSAKIFGARRDPFLGFILPKNFL
jgi:hypothetical protein